MQREGISTTTNGLAPTAASTALTHSASSGGEQVVFAPTDALLQPPPDLPACNPARLFDRPSGDRTSSMPQSDPPGSPLLEIRWEFSRLRPGANLDPSAIPPILVWVQGGFHDLRGNEYAYGPTGQIVYQLHHGSAQPFGSEEVIIIHPNFSPLDGTTRQGADFQAGSISSLEI